MFTNAFVFVAFLAVAKASVIALPETKVVKTTIQGPSGHITQEERLPVVAHEVVESLPVPEVRLQEVPVAVAPTHFVQHQEVSLVHHPEVITVPHEVVVQPHQVLLQHEQLPLVPFVHPVHHTPLIVKSLPHVLPYVAHASHPLYYYK